jgi:DUF917 family protein
LRTAADQAGGFIASARNPLRASYIRTHAALGGISLALKLGEAIIDAERRGGAAVIDAICKTTGGHMIAQGRIRSKRVAYMNEAFDIGALIVGDGDKAMTLHVMNEYMAVDDAGGKRLATFPSVITTLSRDGEPLSVGELREGMEAFVLHVPKEILPLSAGVLDATVYPPVEKAMGIEIARYALTGG